VINPKISVLMSAYNAEDYIEDAIQSILTQTYRNYEFIIFNDGSTDNTLGIINDFADQDKRIRLIDQKNIGLTKTLVKGVNLAKGQYVARMDADDISDVKRLEIQLDFMDRNINCGMVGSWISTIDANGFEIRKIKLHSQNSGLKKRLNQGNQFVHGSVFFRKDMYLLAGGYDADFRFSQDYDLWLRMAKISGCANVSKYLYKLRVHDGSISIKNEALQLSCAVRCLTKNVCHKEIESFLFSIKLGCNCSVCCGSASAQSIETIKIIIMARLLLKRGQYDNAFAYYRKMKSFEGIFMSTILRSSKVTILVKKVYVSFRSILNRINTNV